MKKITEQQLVESAKSLRAYIEEMGGGPGQTAAYTAAQQAKPAAPTAGKPTAATLPADLPGSVANLAAAATGTPTANPAEQARLAAAQAAPGSGSSVTGVAKPAVSGQATAATDPRVAAAGLAAPAPSIAAQTAANNAPAAPTGAAKPAAAGAPKGAYEKDFPTATAKELQTKLNAAGEKLTVDGKMGPATRAAMARHPEITTNPNAAPAAAPAGQLANPGEMPADMAAQMAAQTAPAPAGAANPWAPKTDTSKQDAWAKLSPEQQKWLGGADPTDPIIAARMRSAVPDAAPAVKESVSYGEDQALARIVQLSRF